MKKIKKLLMSFLFALCVIFVISIPVKASGSSWIDKSKGAYKVVYDLDAREDDKLEEDEDEKKDDINAFEALFSSFIRSFGARFYVLFNSGNIPVSIDGIVYGRMAKGVNVSYTKFELAENNVWGITGSYIYVFFRRTALTVFIIAFLVFLIPHLFKKDARGRLEVKSLMINGLFIFMLLYIMPLFVEVVQYVIDALLFASSEWLEDVIKTIAGGDVTLDPEKSGFSSDVLAVLEAALTNYNSSFVINVYHALYMESPTVLNACLFVASVFAGLFFFGEYVRVSLLCTASFSAFPAVCLAALKNPRALTGWAKLFFPNLLIPLIDGVLLYVPMMIFQVYLATVDGAAFVIVFIVLIAIWAIIPTRNILLRKMGYEGLMPKGGGFGGVVAAAAMMLMRGFMSGGGRGHGGGRTETAADVIDTDKAADVYNTMSKNVLEADKHMALPDFDNSAHNEAYIGGPSDTMFDGHVDEMLAGMGQNDGSVDIPGVMNDVDVPTGAFSDEAALEGMVYGNAVPGNVGYDGMDVNPDNIVSSGVTSEGVLSDMNSSDVIGSGEDSINTYGLDNSVIPGTEVADSMSLDGKDMELPVDSAMAGYSEIDAARARELAAFSADEPERALNVASLDTHRNDDFYNSDVMSAPRDKARYDNLARMDALKSKVSVNDDIIKSSGFHPDTYAADKWSQIDKNVHIGRQIDSIDNQLATMSGDSGAALRAQRAKLVSAQARGNQRIKDLDNAYMAHKENEFYNSHIQECAAREQAYARNTALGGQSGQTFASASEFEHTQKANAARASLANFHNFDSRQFDGLLSPEKREEYYRQRSIHVAQERVRRNVTTAAKITGAVTLGGMGAVAATYGGPKAMSTAAIAGGFVGSYAGKKTADFTYATDTVTNHVGTAAAKRVNNPGTSNRSADGTRRQEQRTAGREGRHNSKPVRESSRYEAAVNQVRRDADKGTQEALNHRGESSNKPVNENSRYDAAINQVRRDADKGTQEALNHRGEQK